MQTTEQQFPSNTVEPPLSGLLEPPSTSRLSAITTPLISTRMCAAITGASEVAEIAEMIHGSLEINFMLPKVLAVLKIFSRSATYTGSPYQQYKFIFRGKCYLDFPAGELGLVKLAPTSSELFYSYYRQHIVLIDVLTHPCCT